MKKYLIQIALCALVSTFLIGCAGGGIGNGDAYVGGGDYTVAQMQSDFQAATELLGKTLEAMDSSSTVLDTGSSCLGIHETCRVSQNLSDEARKAALDLVTQHHDDILALIKAGVTIQIVTDAADLTAPDQNGDTTEVPARTQLQKGAPIQIAFNDFKNLTGTAHTPGSLSATAQRIQVVAHELLHQVLLIGDWSEEEGEYVKVAFTDAGGILGAAYDDLAMLQGLPNLPSLPDITALGTGLQGSTANNSSQANTSNNSSQGSTSKSSSQEVQPLSLPQLPGLPPLSSLPSLPFPPVIP